MRDRYKIFDQTRPYFVAFATEGWVDVLTRPDYRNIVVDSLYYCQKEKGLIIHAWCLMSNHLHLVVSSGADEKLEDIIRDFKKYTSVQICRAIEENQRESRKDWMLEIFRFAGEKSGKHVHYKFWQNEYHPVELLSNAVMDQKIDYIHANPVKELVVENPEDYVYSSARDYAGRKGLLEVGFAD